MPIFINSEKDYRILFTPSFERQLRKLKRKDAVLFERVTKKLREIRQYPLHFKPLKNVLKGTRRAHLDPFVILFEVEGDLITVHYVKHHNEAY
jgi:addiction module RelE/StbE family toxin